MIRLLVVIAHLAGAGPRLPPHQRTFTQEENARFWACWRGKAEQQCNASRNKLHDPACAEARRCYRSAR